MKHGRSLVALLGVSIVAFVGIAGCAADEPAPKATTGDEQDLTLGLGPGLTEVSLTLDPKKVMVDLFGAQVPVDICAQDAAITPGANACKLSVNVLGARMWMSSISFSEVKFAGVLPIRIEDLPIVVEGVTSRVELGLGDGKCVFDPTSSKPDVKTKSIPFEIAVELSGNNAQADGGAAVPATTAGQQRTLVDAVLDHLTIKLGVTPADFHACSDGCYDASLASPTATCEASDTQISQLIATTLSGDLAELVRPMLHDAVAHRAGR